MISYEMLVRTRPVLTPLYEGRNSAIRRVESRLYVERLEKEMDFFLESLRRHTNVVDYEKKSQSNQVYMII